MRGWESGVKVTIFNHEYTLKSDSREDEQSLRQIAAYVDKKLKEIATSIPHKSYEQICVLACLNVAAELFTLQQKNSRAKQKLAELLGKLNKKII